MSKRFLAVLLLLFLPLSAAAGEADPTMDPLSMPAQSSLGPQTSGGSSGGSNADSGSLQPAGLAPLQSTPKDSTGLTAPTSSVLQAPANSEYALKVLAGEADGEPQQMDEATSLWGWLVFTIIFGLIAAGAAIVVRDRRRFGKTEPNHDTAQHTHH